MARKGFRRTAVKDVALSQMEDFTANSIQGDVEAHPVMDGRKIHSIAIGRYLRTMTENGSIISWTKEREKSKTYRVNGFHIKGQKLHSVILGKTSRRK